MTTLVRIPNSTPIAALPIVVLDLETTGLDVRQDRVVQVGAVEMAGSRIIDPALVDTLVDPGVPIPEKSTQIHGIGDGDVAGAPAFPEVVEQLSSALSGRIVMGHSIGFDLAVLAHEAHRAGIEWEDPVAIDLSMIAGALEPSTADLGLDSLAAGAGIEISGRHTALGDCQATARIIGMLIPKIEQRDVRTLGELLTFAERRGDLKSRFAEAGWYERPDSHLGTASAGAIPRLDTHIFSERLHEVMSTPVRLVGPRTSVLEAAREMVSRGIGAVIVGAGDQPASGIVTERDVLKLFARSDSDPQATPVESIMSSPVASMDEDEFLYRALARMDRGGTRHLLVVNDAGLPTGMVSQRDLLESRARHAAALGDLISRAGDATELGAAYRRLPEIASGLLAEGLDGAQVARVISAELKAATGRAAELALAEINGDGLLPPVSEWCMVVLGSGGRGESLLGADQDNALIYAKTPDEAVEQRFAELGARVADLLDEAGVDRCQGGVMAANQKWRGSLDQWRERLEDWLNRANPEDLLNVDIFFDLAPVVGNRTLAYELHAVAVEAASRNNVFLSLLEESVSRLASSVGWFGRLPTQEGRVDLKRIGLLPLVSTARSLALRNGSVTRSTPQRLRDVAAAGRISPRDANALVETHRQLMTTILGQQLIDIEAGQRPSNKVDTRRLGRDEVSALRRRVRNLNNIVGEIRSMH